MSTSGASFGLPPRLSSEEKARLQAMSPSNRFYKRGYAIVTHASLDIHSKVSGHAQAILIEEIIHATFGAPSNPEWALIKLTHLAAKSRYGRKAFEIAAEDAADRGLIERKREGRFWVMKVVPEDWDSVPDYVSPPWPPLILMEGGRQRDPVSGRFYLDRRVSMSELQVADPAACQFEPVMRTALPVEVSLEVYADGVIGVVVSDLENRNNGDDDGGTEGEYLLAQDPSDAPKVRHSFAYVLTPIFVKTFDKTPDDALISQILSLVSGAPPEMLLKRIEEKIAAGTFKKSGLVLELARDVGEAWLAGAGLRAAEAEHARRQSVAAADAAAFNGVMAEIGESVEDFRRITGNTAATADDWIHAQMLAEERAIADGRLKPRT